MALRIRIQEGLDGPERTLVMRESPVTVGRNALNDLTLDSEFVSAYHGQFDFSRNEIVYVDHRSTNGTDIDGEAIPQGIPIAVPSDDTRVSIGPYHLRLGWTDQEQTSGAKRPPTVGLTGLPRALTAAQDLTALRSQSQSASLDRLVAPVAPVPQPVGPREAPSNEAVTSLEAPAVDTPAQPSFEELARPAAGSSELHEAYQTYRRTWTALLARLRAEISEAPPAQREIVAFNLVSEFPQISLEPEFARMLKDLQIEQASLLCIDMDDWVSRLTGRSADSVRKVNYALVVERVGNIVGAFADALLNLRRGYQESRNELGLMMPHEQGVLERANDRKEVIQYLMALENEQVDALDALRRAFAELPRHQVALLSGVREGARELLRDFSPESLAADRAPRPTTALAARSFAMLERLAQLWPVAPIVQWNRHRRRYEDALDGDRFVKKLFGDRFREAYFQLMKSR